MQEMRQIKDLKKGEHITGTNGSSLQIISLIKNKLFYYNEQTREFKEKKVNVNNFVFMEG